MANHENPFHDLFPNTAAESILDCSTLAKEAASMLEDIAVPRLDYLRRNRIVYVPFFERGLFDHAGAILRTWRTPLLEGFSVLELGCTSATEPPALALGACAKLRYLQEEGFTHAPPSGRHLMWMEFPLSCLLIDFEVTGCFCHPEMVEGLFGAPLSRHLAEFRRYCGMIEPGERDYYPVDAAEVYERQWAALA